MKTAVVIFGVILGVIMVEGFGGSEDRFIKKYAMMKVSFSFKLW